jgi:class 3 adenylate cyclase
MTPAIPLRVLFPVLLALSACDYPQPVQVQDGALDLSAHDFETQGTVQLNGEWGFHWDQLLDPAEPVPPATQTLGVPGTWGDDLVAPSTQGAATYTLELTLAPETAYELQILNVAGAHHGWVNGQPLIHQAGVVSLDPAQVQEFVAPTETVFMTGPDGQVDVVLHVANQRHRTAGVRRPILLGELGQLSSARTRVTVADSLSAGAKALMAIGFLLLFAMRRSDTRSLYFGLFAAVAALHIPFSGTAQFWSVLWPSMPWVPRLRFEYFLVGIGVWAGYSLVLRVAGADRTKWVHRLLRGSGLIVAGLAYLWPIIGIQPYFLALQTVLGVGAVSAVVVLYQGWRRGSTTSVLMLAASVPFSLAVVHDILRSLDIVHSPLSLTGAFFDLLIVSEGLILVRSFVAAFAANERLTEGLRASNSTLARTNEAILRFVPLEFLSLLGHRNVTEVERGDQVRLQMEVLFCDIRGFTPLVEGMGEQRAFPFINQWVYAMEPAIRRHGGFINQVLGDAILALFSNGADEALQAAIEMVSALQEFNASSEHPLEMGFGLNSGELMLGTIGGRERLVDGVIGDTVNQAARIEGMTKMYDTILLLGENTHRRLQHPERVALRELDRVISKGKSEPTAIYEVLDVLPADARDAKLATLERFAAALVDYRAGRLGPALAGFRACASEHDAVARLYVDRCLALERQGVPEGWTGVTALTQK